MTIRTAGAEDGVRVGEIHVRCRREMPYAALPFPDSEVIRHFAESVVAQGSTYVAEIDGEPVGFLTLIDGWIEHLYVDPSHQNQGIGNSLLALAKETTPAGLQLWTFQANRSARRFYVRHGFREVEETDGATNMERAPDVRLQWP